MSYEYVAAEPFLSFQYNNLLKIFLDYSLFSLSNTFKGVKIIETTLHHGVSPLAEANV